LPQGVSVQVRPEAPDRWPFEGAAPVAAWVALFSSVPVPVMTVLVMPAFCIVACGNTAFGLLSNRPAIMLGDISYGIHLVHGLPAMRQTKRVAAWIRMKPRAPAALAAADSSRPL
jgi:peptidoglycan/LPS O-acetylase OafA/YrhL